jgi:metal-responsive CopG/Arc/MetJ family transcriptional regulator
MRIVSVSLNDKEEKALKKICKVREINRHHAIKLAIRNYIAEFEQNELHHRVPDFKLVECPSNK